MPIKLFIYWFIFSIIGITISSARTIDIYINAEPATAGISLSLNNQPVSYNELVAMLERASSISNDFSIRIIADNTLTLGAVARITQKVRNIGFYNISIIVSFAQNDGPEYVVLFGKSEDMPLMGASDAGTIPLSGEHGSE